MIPKTYETILVKALFWFFFLRESKSLYFKRYAYEEFYPLTSEEMDQYELKNKNSEEKFHRKSYQVKKSN